MLKFYLLVFIPLFILVCFLCYILYKQKHLDVYEEPEDLKDLTTTERIKRH